MGAIRNQRREVEDRCIVSCGILYQELTHLVETGFFSPKRVLFTPPGLHAVPERLEEQLLDRLDRATVLCAEDRHEKRQAETS